MVPPRYRRFSVAGSLRPAMRSLLPHGEVEVGVSLDHFEPVDISVWLVAVRETGQQVSAVREQGGHALVAVLDDIDLLVVVRHKIAVAVADIAPDLWGAFDP